MDEELVQKQLEFSQTENKALQLQMALDAAKHDERSRLLNEQLQSVGKLNQQLLQEIQALK